MTRLRTSATVSARAPVRIEQLPHSSASRQGDVVDTFRVEALLRQLEYQTGLATARGERGIDAAWPRAELGLVR